MSAGATLAELQAEIEIDPAPLAGVLEQFIREHMVGLNRNGVVLGLSGGIDSAVVAGFCARAVGPERTLAVIMPDSDSDREHTGDALSLARKLGIRWKLIELTPGLAALGAYRTHASAACRPGDRRRRGCCSGPPASIEGRRPGPRRRQAFGG